MTADLARPPRLGDWTSFAELQRIQDAQLQRTLAAAAGSPFYRSRLGGVPTCRAELADLPVTTKHDLRAAYPFGLLAVPRSAVATYHESSGTSGEPTSSYYTADDWDDLVERFARKWVGIGPDDTLLVKTPYALMLTAHVAHAGGLARGATVVPADNRSSAMPYSRVVRLLHDLGVTLTWSLPTDVLIWAAAAVAAGHRPDADFPALRALLVAGEPLSVARRRRIEEIWHAPVVEDYGATEVGPLAGQCPEGRLHLWADRAIVEVLDPATGHISREGRGRLVVTPLYREAMPLLRYDIEDQVEVAYDDCACGWYLPTLRVYGRSRVGDPALPSNLEIEELVFGLPAEFGVLFWRARYTGPRLDVQIEVSERHGRAAARCLTRAAQFAFDRPIRVEAVPPGSLVPAAILTAQADVLKPRGLFHAGENWDAGLEYFTGPTIMVKRR